DSINILSGYMIDPKRENNFNFLSVDKYLNQMFPNITDTGILCINIENEVYQELKTNNLNSVRFKNAEKQFIDLLRYIKGVRPNLKIGIYGIPFRTYYPSQLKWNGDRKFDRLMSMSDIVFPSLYIIYPDKEKGKD